MRKSRPALSLVMIAVLFGCGKPQHSPEPPTPTGKTNPHAAARGRAPSAPIAEQPADLPAKITRLNEDGSETVEDVPSDSGAHNPLLAAVASTVAAGSATASAAALPGPAAWQEGVNYTRLVPAQPTDAAPGQVEVLEFFWYACPHCSALDPLVEAWKKSKPTYVTFTRVPVLWNESHRALARLYYTMVSLGKIDAVHQAIFREIHSEGNPLVAADPNNAAENERIQSAFAAKFGIAPADFKHAYDSLAVQTALQHADELVHRYRIDGVPTFVVNGKYLADVRSADGGERLLALVGDLATQEHKH